MKLIVASKNKHKAIELSALFDDARIEVLPLPDGVEMPEEDGATYVDNARIKAVHAKKFVPADAWVLADDSGLSVDALSGAPGVFSARYAGPDVSYKANNEKLLRSLEGVPDNMRAAHFVCSMVLIAPDGREFTAENHVDGIIINELKGEGGFGYDPVFFLPEFAATFAELPPSVKNHISHRGRAAKQILAILVEFLNGKG